MKNLKGPTNNTKIPLPPINLTPTICNQISTCPESLLNKPTGEHAKNCHTKDYSACSEYQIK